MPSFQELWDVCVEQRVSPSADVFERVFKQYGIGLSAHILDVCSGSGSLDIEFLKRGYHLATTDGDPGMLELFKQRLHEQGVAHEPRLVKWLDLPCVFENEHFDAVICAGNSLIYAGGYWNNDGVIDREASLAGIRETLAIFRAQLKPGGVLLVDKPTDNERPVEELVAHVCVGDKDQYDVLFSVKFDEARKRRAAQILLQHRVTRAKIGVPNVAYHLRDAELEVLLREAGFSSIERIVHGENGHFPLWAARA